MPLPGAVYALALCTFTLIAFEFMPISQSSTARMFDIRWVAIYAPRGGSWIYDFRHIFLGPLGRVVLTVLPDGAHTHISCELAENPDVEITAGRRKIFEPLGREIADRLE